MRRNLGLPEAPSEAWAPRDGAVEARVAKHSLIVAGHRTSVSLEDAFWRRLQGIATRRGLSVNALVATIDVSRGAANLSSALRVYVLETASADRSDAAERQ
jgi:predicted DNA-binding ribbon-helix-helix protein